MINQETNSKNKNTLKAASWYTISNFVAKVALYIFTPYYARVLTSAEYGQYTNFLSWQSILVVLMTFDLYSTIAIAYVDYKDEEFDSYISSISVFSLIVPLLLSVVPICTIGFFSELTSMRGIHLLMMLFGIVFSSALPIFQTEQRSKVKYKIASAITLVSAFSNMILTVLLVTVLNDKLNGVIFGGVIANSIINLGIYFFIFGRKFSFCKSHISYALKIALPLIPHALAATILGSSDKVMINKMCGDEQTAFYGIIFTCSMVVTLFVTSLNNAWVPWFFSEISDEKYESVKKVSIVTTTLIGVVAFGLCIVAPEIILIVGGRKYMGAMTLMPPIILSCFFRYVYTLYVNVEFYLKKTGWISFGTILTSATNVVLNYICIKRFGFIAAAYTTLFSNVLLLVIHVYVVRRENMLKLFNNRMIFLLIAMFSVLCMGSLLLYSNTIIRYTTAAAILLASVVVLTIKRQAVRKAIKSLR